MPIRWDHSKDHILLMKLIETNKDLKVNVVAIAEAWPVSEGQAKPTPRAITERIVKIRQLMSGKQDRNGTKPSNASGIAPKARNTPITVATTPVKNKMRTKPIKAEDNGNIDFTQADHVNDGDNESEGTMPFPSAQRSSPLLSSPAPKVVVPATGLPTPKTERKKSATPNRKSFHHESTPNETESDSLTDLSPILKGKPGKRMQTRGKRVTKYDSDEGQKDSEVSEFGVEKD